MYIKEWVSGIRSELKVVELSSGRSVGQGYDQMKCSLNPQDRRIQKSCKLFNPAVTIQRRATILKSCLSSLIGIEYMARFIFIKCGQHDFQTLFKIRTILSLI